MQHDDSSSQAPAVAAVAAYVSATADSLPVTGDVGCGPRADDVAAAAAARERSLHAPARTDATGQDCTPVVAPAPGTSHDGLTEKGNALAVTDPEAPENTATAAWADAVTRVGSEDAMASWVDSVAGASRARDDGDDNARLSADEPLDMMRVDGAQIPPPYGLEDDETPLAVVPGSRAKAKASDARCKPVKSSKKRSRAEDAQEEGARSAFRHSQRSLRKEAKGMNLREILSRSQSFAGNEFSSPTAEAHEGEGSAGAYVGCFSSPAVASPSSNAGSMPSATFPGEGIDRNGLLSPASPLANGSAWGSSESLPGSPSGATAFSPTWGGSTSADITKNFLANVQRQKRQQVERLMNPRGTTRHAARTTPTSVGSLSGYPPDPRVLASSADTLAQGSRQDSTLALTHSRQSLVAHAQETDSLSSASEEEELVIGAPVGRLPSAPEAAGNDDAVAGAWEEAETDFSSPSHAATSQLGYASQHSIRLCRTTASMLYDAASQSAECTLSRVDSTDACAAVDGPRGLQALDENVQQQQRQTQSAREEAAETALVVAATRRHELWRLTQRHRRAQRLLETDKSGVEAKSQEAGNSVPPTTHAPARAGVGATLDLGSVGHSLPSGSSLPMSPTSPSGVTRRASFISGVSLSESDVSLIVRRNSFDRTSSQKMVVFGAAAKGDAKQ